MTCGAGAFREYLRSVQHLYGFAGIYLRSVQQVSCRKPMKTDRNEREIGLWGGNVREAVLHRTQIDVYNLAKVLHTTQIPRPEAC